MGQLPAELRRSLTWDQGSESALHADIAQALTMPVFRRHRRRLHQPDPRLAR